MWQVETSTALRKIKLMWCIKVWREDVLVLSDWQHLEDTATSIVSMQDTLTQHVMAVSHISMMHLT